MQTSRGISVSGSYSHTPLLSLSLPPLSLTLCHSFSLLLSFPPSLPPTIPTAPSASPCLENCMSGPGAQRRDSTLMTLTLVADSHPCLHLGSLARLWVGDMPLLTVPRKLGKGEVENRKERKRKEKKRAPIRTPQPYPGK